MISAAQVFSEAKQTEMFRLAAYEPATFGCAGDLLSPSQVRTFMDCQARWFFKYVERLPDPQTSSLALGKAVHAAIAENFAQKIETKEDLELTGFWRFTGRRGLSRRSGRCSGRTKMPWRLGSVARD